MGQQISHYTLYTFSVSFLSLYSFPDKKQHAERKMVKFEIIFTFNAISFSSVSLHVLIISLLTGLWIFIKGERRMA